jgi:hypothetical protein
MRQHTALAHVRTFTPITFTNGFPATTINAVMPIDAAKMPRLFSSAMRLATNGCDLRRAGHGSTTAARETDRYDSLREEAPTERI